MLRENTIAVALAVAMALPPLPAQQALAPVKQPAQSSGTLILKVLEGEAAQNNIRAKTATAPAVEVRDEAEKPVAGAEVVFQLPATGAGGVFHGWMRTQTVRTDSQGQARATGFTPNGEEGRFNIKVTATAGNKTGQVVIGQSNVTGSANGARGGRPRWVIPVVVLGVGGLIGGVVAATRDGSTPAAAAVTNPIIVSPGAITVAGPR